MRDGFATCNADCFSVARSFGFVFTLVLNNHIAMYICYVQKLMLLCSTIVTGASFVVFNGALKSNNDIRAKVSIVEGKFQAFTIPLIFMVSL